MQPANRVILALAGQLALSDLLDLLALLDRLGHPVTQVHQAPPVLLDTLELLEPPEQRDHKVLLVRLDRMDRSERLDFRERLGTLVIQVMERRVSRVAQVIQDPSVLRVSPVLLVIQDLVVPPVQQAMVNQGILDRLGR